MRPHRLVISLALALGCQPDPPPPAHVALGGGTVAVVGEVKLSGDLVARVAAAQQTTPQAALQALVDDAIAAQAARKRGLERRADVQWSSSAARARFTADHIVAEAKNGGPPTDDEIADATGRRWRDYDLPEQLRVVHAVVLKKKQGTDAELSRAVAAELLSAVRPTPDADAFEAAVKVVDKRGLDVRVERLPTFIADGRMVEQDGGLDPQFTEASFALAHVGDTSPIVETSFGWHVIRLLERLPEHRVPLEERRVLLADYALSIRMRKLYEATLARAASKGDLVIDPAADSLMAGFSAP